MEDPNTISHAIAGDPTVFLLNKVECQSKQQMDQSCSHILQAEKQNVLKIQIPSEPINLSSEKNGQLLGRSSPSGHWSRRLSFKSNFLKLQSERSFCLKSDISSKPDEREGYEGRVLSIFASTFSYRKWVSLPAKFASQTLHVSKEKTSEEQDSSVDSRQRNTTRNSSCIYAPSGNVVRVKSRSCSIQSELHDTNSHDVTENDDEEIPEEDAICRICLLGLNEGGSWFKMECSCRGDLRLTHEECAVKWFSIKGNMKCDICCHEVLNLPVTLVVVPRSTQHVQQPDISDSDLPQNLSGSGMVLLLLLSTMCYFIVLQQLLVKNRQSHTFMSIAPCASLLGILGTFLAQFLAYKTDAWAYSAFEFSLVALFLYFFYNVLEIKAVIAVTLAALAGFSTTIALNSIWLRFIRCHEARLRALWVNVSPA